MKTKTKKQTDKKQQQQQNKNGHKSQQRTPHYKYLYRADIHTSTHAVVFTCTGHRSLQVHIEDTITCTGRLPLQVHAEEIYTITNTRREDVQSTHSPYNSTGLCVRYTCPLRVFKMVCILFMYLYKSLQVPLEDVYCYNYLYMTLTHTSACRVHTHTHTHLSLIHI